MYHMTKFPLDPLQLTMYQGKSRIFDQILFDPFFGQLAGQKNRTIRV